ncbi:MAG: S26 family signal peptidase [Myxococcota bacterium]|jgi:signal peptidase I|nr:S26 family signal peptidase [Myxococcota bacterium]
MAGQLIPPGQLLVVGDSRGNSRDGRSFGLISEDVAYGKAIGVIWRSDEGLVWKAL